MELFVVVAYATLMVGGIVMLWGGLHNNAYRPVKHDITVGGVFLAYVFVCLIVWALWWATAGSWAVWLLVIEVAIKFPLRMWQAQTQGYYLDTKTNLTIGTIIDAVVVVGLLAAVLGV